MELVDSRIEGSKIAICSNREKKRRNMEKCEFQAFWREQIKREKSIQNLIYFFK